MHEVILASGSPRRRDLMAEAGYDFTVISPDVEEVHEETMPIRELSMLNAKLKAEAVASLHSDRVVIAADTLVSIDDRSLAKPRDMDHAFEMISTLNGRTHEVVTSVCVRCGEKEEAFAVATAVTFKQMTDEQLRAYHDLIEPMDKAGAYAAQDHGTLIIEKMEGSSTNVVGLPMDELGAVLREFGVG